MQAHKILGKYLGRHPLLTPVLEWDGAAPSVVVVVPAYKEQAYLQRTLLSLSAAAAPSGRVLVVVVINTGEKDSPALVAEQKAFAARLRSEISAYLPLWIKLEVLEAYGLSAKFFGAGLARKIGMDAAVELFYRLEQAEGILLTMDADTLVRADYFREVEQWFSAEKRQAANLFFEHPLEGSDFSEEMYEGITRYELHLRYLLQGQRYAGFPYAFHAMGSAIAVRALAYARAGGMSRRQAGEDFYFLQKLIPQGGFGEIQTTRVHPSPRTSDRVVFGTGAAMNSFLAGEQKVGVGLTYNFQAFADLKVFFELRQELFALQAGEYEGWSYKLSGPLRSFLLNARFFDDLEVLKRDCASETTFSKRFFELFSAFKVVKYLNYVHEHFFEQAPVFDMALTLLEQRGLNCDDCWLERDLLLRYRELELEESWFIS